MLFLGVFFFLYLIKLSAGKGSCACSVLVFSINGIFIV